MRGLLVALLLIFPVACTEAASTSARPAVMQWDHRPEGTMWTQAALGALSTHGAALPSTVPQDIETWCPGYEDASVEERRLFWAGLLSALAKHESTWRPEAAGGGGRWIGLLQIAPATARGYGCKATSVAELKNGAANLACAIRIMSRTVPRDGVVAAGGGGIAADWGPFTRAAKRAEMASWVRAQPYCTA
ncbi:transglycosylase SLT domain-containing protein [Roseitranquillus sediminis]|uniref:transglycosylase SLT domain-containing protein n=1 Tax=Roseitranquillus sediminis TaxID=2809051 RepID=UPI001D0C5C74|nr:transglycosylase SLT domain-containing protein [Roseitranquillus sediminis]MBM9594629.1 transglycosylase SLT domain-containing protein [Roseitranquillus sediminis]